MNLTDIVWAMNKVDALHEPSEANELLAAGAKEIIRLRAEIAARFPAAGVPEEIVRGLPAPDVYHGDWDEEEWWAVVRMLRFARSQPTAPAAQREGETP